VIEVEISAEQVEPPSWLPDFTSLTSFTLEHTRFDSAAVRVRFCDPEEIAHLNSRFRRIEGSTDVLSFPDDEQTELLSGDIAICANEVEANAEEFGVSRVEEMCRVYVHALLHLSGFSHGSSHLGDLDAEKEQMFVIQEQIVDRYTKERERE
jgi:probable rRNA maturation factor